jgi:hypothetical protein
MEYTYKINVKVNQVKDIMVEMEFIDRGEIYAKIELLNYLD